MKLRFTIFVLSFFFISIPIYSRQYDVDYFLICVESENPELISNFFKTHQKQFKKKKHIVEFIELLRAKTAEKYGYSPSWMEMHEEILRSENSTKPAQKLLKTIGKKMKSKEVGLHRANSLSFDYQGDINFDDEAEEPVIATTEAIVGALFLMIDTPVTRGVGAFLLSDSASKYINYSLKKKSEENRQYQLERDCSSNRESEDYGCRRNDSYDRHFDSEVR